MRVVIAGGGTGGHLYPGIAMAQEILRRQPDARISFVGTAQGIESRVVPREGFDLDLIRSSGIKGKSLAARARAVGVLPLGLTDAWRILSRRSPDLVIGVGGYSSGPVVLVAALRGVPTLLHEQNAVPGWTNRLLAPVVQAAALTFESTLPYFRRNGFVSGNPVRAEFLEIDTEPVNRAAPSSALRVLVVGGSQGAHAINVGMVEAAPLLAAAALGLAITHQTGERDVEMVRAGYGRAGLEARVEPFLDAMAREMSAADLVVARAGSTTLAEIAVAGRAAILIPLPAVDDHQRRNADVLAGAGAATVIDQAMLSGTALAEQIMQLARDPDRRAAMGVAARTLARPDAARVIVRHALDLVSR